MLTRQRIITAVVFVLVGVITVALLQYGFHVRGGVLKIIIGAIVALIAGGIAFFLTKSPASAQ